MIALSLFLLIASPWFVQLFISPIELSWLTHPISSISELLRNLSLYSSNEFIFFTGDPRLSYGTQEFGLVYLSFLPLWLLGLIRSLSKTPHKYITWWLGLGVLVASLFKPTAPFSAALLYLPAVQILTSLGALHLVTHFRRFHPLIKLGIILLFLFNFYEIANFFHVLTTHYPQRIHEVVLSKQ